MHQRISRHDLPNSNPGDRRMKKTLSGSTPHLVHHGVAALKFSDSELARHGVKCSDAELARRAIVAKYLSPPPGALASGEKDKVKVN
jgi:hypothetical protein